MAAAAAVPLPRAADDGLLLQEAIQGAIHILDSPGFAAMQSGNVPALEWLLERCPGLVGGRSAMQAAGWYCSLPLLQEAWALLSVACDTQPLLRSALEGAAGSPTADAIAKMEWLL